MLKYNSTLLRWYPYLYRFIPPALLIRPLAVHPAHLTAYCAGPVAPYSYTVLEYGTSSARVENPASLLLFHQKRTLSLVQRSPPVTPGAATKNQHFLYL